MRTRLLYNLSELTNFASQYNAYAGAERYKAKDFWGLHVRVFYRQEEIVAGYVVNHTPPYRTLSWIPPMSMRKIDILNREPKTTFAEVNALWINRHLPNSYRASIYCSSVIDCALKKTNYILGGCLVKNVLKTQMRALPHLMWSGTSTPFGKPSDTWIFYAHPLEAVLRLPYAVVGGWYERISKKFAGEKYKYCDW
ncbi:hypothetical protein MHK_004854 [Candidatus Magnetomorum sp. HK-1]|nr:hypothetical protein MHK_004854 [Candidatus Magnetomorum sp. HK-1]